MIVFACSTSSLVSCAITQPFTVGEYQGNDDSKKEAAQEVHQSQLVFVGHLNIPLFIEGLDLTILEQLHRYGYTQYVPIFVQARVHKCWS